MRLEWDWQVREGFLEEERLKQSTRRGGSWPGDGAGMEDIVGRWHRAQLQPGCRKAGPAPREARSPVMPD